jgi:hypothetical protein
MLCFTKCCSVMTGLAYKQSSVDAAVNELNSVLINSLNDAVPYTCTSKSKFPYWFSGVLKHYNNKIINFFRRYKRKKKYATHYASFSYFRKLVKVTTKSDRRRWLKSR